jgi:hypothetical protein
MKIRKKTNRKAARRPMPILVKILTNKPVISPTAITQNKKVEVFECKNFHFLNP